MQTIPGATTLRTHGRARDRHVHILSDERDTWHDHALAMWRDGYRAGAAGLEDAYAAGYAKAIADVKRSEHGIVRSLNRLPHLPSTAPRPGDFPGREPRRAAS